MQYTSDLKKLILPEYGRNVQQMVDHCMTIEDRAERTRCANTIINIMGNLFPHLRDIDDFKHKLWDHLAIMSAIPYHTTPIKYRHYGKIMEGMLKKAEEMPAGPERDALVSMLANHMKKLYYQWNKDSVEDEKILKDLREYTHGVIDLDPATYHLRDVREPVVQPQRNNKSKNNSKKAGK